MCGAEGVANPTRQTKQTAKEKPSRLHGTEPGQGLLGLVLSAEAAVRGPSDLEQSTVTSGTNRSKQASIEHHRSVQHSDAR
jgi:hypothetical protein